MNKTFDTIWHLISGFVVFWAYLACLPFGLFGIWLLANWGLHEAKAVQIEATVVALKQVGSDLHSLRPVFETKGADGSSLTYFSESDFGAAGFELGDRVSASYSESTGIIRANETQSVYLTTGLVFFLIGGVCACVIYFHRRFRRRMKDFYSYPRSQ